MKYKTVAQMTINEKVIHYFFIKELDFFSCVLRTGLSSQNLKNKILKTCLLNCGNRNSFCKELQSRYKNILNANNFKYYESEKTELKFSIRRTKTVSFFLEKANIAIDSYNSIESKLDSALERGELRSVMCKKLGINYENSFRLVPKKENVKTERRVEITTGDIEALKEFESTWFKGRVITKSTRELLKRFGKLEKYEAKQSS